MRQGIANLLLGDGRIQVAQCADGLEAIEAMERQPAEVVLMDLNMPRMNGIEATREIRRRWPHVPVIGLSVNDDQATADSVLEAGAVAFVPKVRDAQGMIDLVLRFGYRQAPAVEK